MPIVMKYPGSGSSLEAGSSFLTINCESTININDIIYIDPTDSIAKKAIANDWTKTQVVGFVYKKKSSTICIVQLSGKIKLSGLDTSKNYYLSDTIPGTMQTTPPTSNYTKRLGRSLINDYFMIELGTLETLRV